MLTRKEIIALNFIFKKLKGKKFDTSPKEVVRELERILPKNVPYEYILNLSLLYYFNWNPQGNFENIKNPIKFNSPSFYFKSREEQIALMLFQKDYNFENFSNTPTNALFLPYHYKGIEYLPIESTREGTLSYGLIHYIYYYYSEKICSNYDIIKDYISISRNEIEEIATYIAEKDTLNLFDDDSDFEINAHILGDPYQQQILKLLDRIRYEEKRIEKREDLIIPFYEKIENAEKNFDDELVKKLETKIQILFDEIENINSNIHDIEEKIYYIQDAAKYTITNQYIELYTDYLEDSPFEFIKSKKMFNDNFINQYVDCERTIKNFVENDVDGAIEYIGFHSLGEVKLNKKRFIILEKS